jgi:hypothetical protein
MFRGDTFVVDEGHDEVRDQIHSHSSLAKEHDFVEVEGLESKAGVVFAHGIDRPAEVAYWNLEAKVFHPR